MMNRATLSPPPRGPEGQSMRPVRQQKPRAPCVVQPSYGTLDTTTTNTHAHTDTHAHTHTRTQTSSTHPPPQPPLPLPRILSSVVSDDDDDDDDGRERVEGWDADEGRREDAVRSSRIALVFLGMIVAVMVAASVSGSIKHSNEVARPPPRVGRQSSLGRRRSSQRGVHGSTSSASQSRSSGGSSTQPGPAKPQQQTGGVGAEGVSVDVRPQDSRDPSAPASASYTGPTCRACTHDECMTHRCDVTSFPYACVSGSGKGGCAQTEAEFVSAGCTECCTLSSCSSLVPKCGQCDPFECRKLSNICGLKRQYVCLEGASSGGCSDKEEQWPQAMISQVCTKCCDLGTCPPMPGCAPCTEAECQEVGKGCSAERHYVCSEGPATGGCGLTEEFWKVAELAGNCNKCCDAAACHKKT